MRKHLKFKFNILVFLAGTLLLFSQNKTLEVNKENDKDLYLYMLYWIDSTSDRNSLSQAVFNLEQGNFKSFDQPNGKNLGLFPEPTYLFLNVKNTSEYPQNYWWTFYTHADTIIVYKKQEKKWLSSDTLTRTELLSERTIKHRAPTYSVFLQQEEEQEYLVKLINPRHTQNAFVSLTSPTHNLLWEKEFYWTIGSFVGVFLIAGIISLIIGLVIKERTLITLFIYLLIISILTLDEELMTPIIENRFIFLLLSRVHPLPLALIATSLNFYIVDYIFGKKDSTKFLRLLNSLNSFCLLAGIICLVVFMIFMNVIHSGQTLFIWVWNIILFCILISIMITLIKTVILSISHKKVRYGIPFLAFIIIINPATYHLNYSGTISLYEITYPNYFYWFASAEFIFIGFLVGWRYKKNLDQQHQLQIELTKKELSVLNNERQQIARDLHDDLGATINTIKLLVTNSYPNDKRLKETVNVASNDIRIFYNKLSYKTYKGSLIDSIENLLALHNSYGKIKFNSVFTGNEKLLSDIQKENIYKIVSEILTNILKHSQATDSTIQLLIDRNTTQLIIEDNGTGFSLEKAKESNGMGLKNIKQRITFMSGNLHISSNKGNTTHIINIPTKS